MNRALQVDLRNMAGSFPDHRNKAGCHHFVDGESCLQFVKMQHLGPKKMPGLGATCPSQTHKPLKPCCTCPETKKESDVCIIEKGEEYCGHLIKTHKECMRALGFKT